MAPSSSRAFSPPSSSISTIGNALVQRPVTKIAIEGRCRAEGDGASLRMFFKMSIPTEGLVPGAAIPLFPEENVRIITSKVHPLDPNSAPYAFSTTAAPLLHRTARALNLPPRLTKSYYPIVGVPAPPTSPGDPSSYRKNSSQPLGISLTGEINVSKFHVCFILPKVFPPRLGDVDNTGYMNGHGSHSRRNSIVDRNTMLFMAGVELFIPFHSKPPKSPFALSIPVPRCLHNTIKLRVPPPPRSLATDDPPPWDFTSDPFISNSRNRSNSYELLEDDEESLSDSQASSSSAGFSSSGVQGNFPSTDSLRIRWAAPMSKHAGTGVLADGRRRVVIDDVVGLTKCTILERDVTGMKVRLVYEARCRGVSFPGVAIHLAMDIVLNAKGREVTWLSEDDKWEISGGKGFTGFDVGGGRPPQSSLASTRATLTPSRHGLSRPTIPPSRSSLTTASLLRAPLPNLNASDYSFETSQSPTPSMIPSDISSAIQSFHVASRSPTQPVTVNVNISVLDVPPHNEFTVRIAGTVFISTTGLSSGSPHEVDDNVLSLPVFRIPTAERERVEVAVSSETLEGLQLVMPDPTGKTPPRRRLLRKRSEVKTEEGVGVLFSPSPSPHSTSSSIPLTPEAKLLGPNGVTPTRRGPGPRSSMNPLPLPVTGPAILPTVQVTLTPLPNSSKHSHAIRLCLPLPYSNISSADSNHSAASSPFQFGVLLPLSLIALGNEQLPTVTLVSSTVSSIAVRGEVYPRVAESGGGQPSPLRGAFDEADDEYPPSPNRPAQLGREFVCWVQVHIEDEGAEAVSTVGAPLEVVYLVGKQQGEEEEQQHGSSKPRINPPFKVEAFLPCFVLDVGQLNIHVETPLGYESPALISTNLHQHQPFKLTNYSLPPYFTPRLTFAVQAIPKGLKSSLGAPEQQTFLAVMRYLSQIIPFLVLYLLWTISTEVRELRAVTDDIASVSGIGSWSLNEGARWQLGNEGTTPQPKTTTIVSETLTLTFPGRATSAAPGVNTPSPTPAPTTSLAIDLPSHPFFKIVPDIHTFISSELAVPFRNFVNILAATDLGVFTGAGSLMFSKLLGALRWLVSYPMPP